MPKSFKRMPKFLKRTTYAPSPTQWLVGPSTAGVYVTPETALNSTAVFCAVDTISSDFASLDCEIRKRTGSRSSVVDTSHPAWDRLRLQPNPHCNSNAFWQAVVACALVHGNSYIEIERDPEYGDIVALWLLDPRHVELKVRKNSGKLYYQVGKLQLELWEVAHIKGPSLNGLLGLVTYEVGKEAIAGSLGSQKFANSLFGNGCVPQGIIKTKGKLTENARKNLREGVENVHRGVDQSHRLMILEYDQDWVQTQISPEQSQMLQTRVFSVQEISRLFKISPQKLFDLSHGTMANYEQSSRDYYMTTLRPWVERIEAELDVKLFTPSERQLYFVRFNMRDILRGDDAARTAYWTGLRNVGAVSVNEIRQAEGYDEVEGGDAYYAPLNFGRIDQNGDVIPPKAQESTEQLALSAPEPKALPAPEQPALPAPDAARTSVNAFRGVVADAVGRMVRREVKALRTAAKKDWQERLVAMDEFYRSHEAVLVEALQPSLQAMGELSGRKLDVEAIAHRIVKGSIEQIGDGEHLVELLDDWEANREQNITDSIMNTLEDNEHES